MRRRRSHAAIWFLVAALLVGGFVYFVTDNVVPSMLAIGEIQTKALAQRAIYQAVQQEIAEQVTFDELIRYERDVNGRIVSSRANLPRIHSMVARTTVTVQDELAALEQLNFGVPLGQVLGSRMLAIYGPELPVGVIPVGAAEVTVDETFEEAGINQTRHVIHLVAHTDLRVAIPFYARQIRVETKIPVAESILAGEVPETYLNISLGR